jgi:hypothetical protein
VKPPKKPAKTKAKAKTAPKDTRPQRVRFEEAAAKAGGIDEGMFERAIGRVAPPKKRKS